MSMVTVDAPFNLVGRRDAVGSFTNTVRYDIMYNKNLIKMVVMDVMNVGDVKR